MLAGLLNYPLTLKMEVIRSSEKSGTTQGTTQRHIPKDDTLHNHRCENLKSYKYNNVFSNKIKPFHVSASDGHWRATSTSEECFSYMHVVLYGLH
jgi:hypothetical protein